ncbi:hypothetical protein LCGC14_1679000 [marine sediment metagenome]|uniref:Uncharacterized protein n=1 Tax=marine sediment metagenome TaxID=412755 RepID=A0A0F9HPA5_9ZZZZ
MGIDTAKVEVTLGDLNALQDKKRAAEQELADAKTLITELELRGDDSVEKKLSDALNAAIIVVQFAVANLEPLAFRGWPFEALRELAEALPHLPGVHDRVKEISNTLVVFAARAADWEDARARGVEQEKFASENAAMGAISLPES